MKRVLLVLLLFSLTVPAIVEAKKKPFGDGLYWELTDDGVLTISGNGRMPDKQRGYPWQRHYRHNEINLVHIQNGVQNIGSYAFFYCINLRAVKIPNSVKEINECSFAECKILKSVVIPNSVSKIGKRAFAGCGFESITIPNSVSVIGDYAFCGTSLKYITIPRSVKSIGKGAFGVSISVPYSGEIRQLPDYVADSDDPTYWGLSRKSVDIYNNGIKDGNGQLLLAANSYHKISKHTDSNMQEYYIVEEGTNVGVISSGGNWIIPCKYSNISPIGGFYLKVKNGSGYGVMTTSGKEIIPTSRGYTSISDYNSTNRTFTFTKPGYKGTCNLQGQETSISKVPLTASDVETKLGCFRTKALSSNGNQYFIIESYNDKFGLADGEGNKIIDYELEALEPAGTGYLRFKLNGFWGLMNYNGKILIDTDRGYTSIGDYVSFTKRFAYTMNGYKGECDATGRQISKISTATAQSHTSTASVSKSNNSSSSLGSKTQTVVVEHHRDPVPVQEWQACFGCGGMGTMGCDFCGGSGTKYVGDNLRRCSRCNGRGIIPCNICYGNKGKYITVYR